MMLITFVILIILAISRRYPSTDVNRDCKESYRAVQKLLQKRIGSIIVTTLVPNFAQNFVMISVPKIRSRLGNRSANLPNHRPERARFDPWKGPKRAKIAQEPSRSGKERPKSLPIAPKSAPRPPKNDQERPNITPRGAQERPTSAQERPTLAQRRPTGA